MTKILVGIAYHEAKRYAINHVLDWVRDQAYKDVEVVMRTHTGPYGENNAVKEQREFFRKLALDMNVPLFSMGADTIPPLDALQRLSNRHEPIVGGLYYYRTEDRPAVAWVDEDFDKDFLKTEDELVEVSGMGMDCVLLQPKVLQAISFLEWEAIDDDGPFYRLAKERGFTPYLDKTVECRHYKDENWWA